MGSDCLHLKDVDMLHQRCNGRKLSQFQPRVMLSLPGKNSWCIDLPRSGSFWNFACSTLDKHQHVFFVGSTLQKFNSSPPENRPGPKGKHSLPTIHFSGAKMLVLGKVCIFFKLIEAI